MDKCKYCSAENHAMSVDNGPGPFCFETLQSELKSARDRADYAVRELETAEYLLSCVRDALNGHCVSEFAMSFGIVREAFDVAMSLAGYKKAYGRLKKLASIAGVSICELH